MIFLALRHFLYFVPPNNVPPRIQWKLNTLLDHHFPLQAYAKQLFNLAIPSFNTSSGTANVILAHPFSSSLPLYDLPGLTLTPPSRNLSTAVASSSHVVAPGATLANTNKLALAGMNSRFSPQSIELTMLYELDKRSEFSFMREGSEAR
jgi:hypothetical protein